MTELPKADSIQAAPLPTAHSAMNDRVVAGLEGRLSRIQRMGTIGALSAGLAHDFNNLLLVIRGNLGLVLMDEQLSSPSRTRLEQAEQATARATEFTQQILSLGRLAEPKAAVLDFNQVIQDAAGLARRAWRTRMTFNIHPAEAPLRVRMDPAQAIQVLLNLCFNAHEAMPQGGSVTITSALTHLAGAQAARVQRASGAPFMRCSVADTGKGIEPEILPRIFDPFFTTKDGKSAGLGLFVVRHLVEVAGGLVDVESVVGTGSTFHVCLPIDS